MTFKTEENVLAGAQWLDENHPGWAEQVNLLTLDMVHNCILDQVIPATEDGERGFDQITAELGGVWATRHGFCSFGGGAVEVQTQLWTDEVQTRVVAAVAA